MSTDAPRLPAVLPAEPRTLEALAERLDGELRLDDLHRMLYAQDASVYQEQPAGVVFPRHREDVAQTIRAASALGLSIIPRAAGTSLAGQCVGSGLVMDVGRHMSAILELNVAERWVRVQPGVILDDLNRALAPHGLFFGPDTSTSNRCMIGGMIGNNSCGTHSILYGTTRDHVLELEVVFADASCERIKPWTLAELRAHTDSSNKGALATGLRALQGILSEHEALIHERYPRPGVLRRNTGYAFDELLFSSAPYAEGAHTFDLNRLLAGSEGTLGIITEAKLNLVAAPKHRGVLVAHFHELQDALQATVIAVQHEPAAVELIDRRILELAKENIAQQRNRFFLEGDPDAVLAVEFYRDSPEEITRAAEALAQAFQDASLGYAYPMIHPPEDGAVWALRKAGLGILMGAKGDIKPVTVVEDTAVAVEVLPDYIREFAALMERYGTQCVYYAHASVGELHMRPELNLKDAVDVEKFVGIARDVTDLVKKYGGSISGEHGDGRLRSPMLEQFYGPELTRAHRALKAAFDPRGLLNPGKIVDPAPIDAHWRFEPGEQTPQVDTLYNWEADEGLVRSIEKCNGAGACRKLAGSGGTMCPSYMVTLEEKDSTRGRANVFRNLIRENQDPRQAMASKDLYDAMDLCLSCKGCKSECPASVDMSRMKAEFLQHYHDQHGTPLSSWFFGNYPKLSKLATLWPALSNAISGTGAARWSMRRVLGIAPERDLPKFAKKTFSQTYVAWRRATGGAEQGPVVGLYVDPFTEYLEPELGMSAVRVLESAGWRVKIIPVHDDGRTYLSKGLLRDARKLLDVAIERGHKWSQKHPEARIVGIEPSAILTFRDEAPDLVSPELRQDALRFGERCMLFEEFVVWAHDVRGHFSPPWRQESMGEVVLHGHCHQKALVGTRASERALEIAGYKVKTLATGCCGMAGSFGYEEEHYELSMKVGELVLFPAVREVPMGGAVAAPGTSCRHQIFDGTGRSARHPIQWLEWALPAELVVG